MGNPVLYVIIGLIIGAAGALVAVGAVLWSRPSASPPPAPPPPDPNPVDDESIRLIQDEGGQWVVETSGKRYKRLSEVQGAVLTRRLQDALAWLGQFAGQPIVAPPPAPPPQADASEVLRVWRARADGAMLVEFRGKRYRRLADITDANIGRELLSVLGDLAAFGKGKTVLRPVSPETPPPEIPAPADALAPAVPPLAETVSISSLPTPDAAQPPVPPPPVEAVPISSLPTPDAAQPPVPPPAVEAVSISSLPTPDAAQPSAPPPASPSVEEEFLRSLLAPQPQPEKPKQGFGGFLRLDRKKKEDAPVLAPEPPEAMGIAGQIEQVLQRQLASRTDMLARGLHVSAAPDGSLRVEVDSQFYNGIDETPDPAVREVLRAAVKAWEASI